MKVWVDAQLSPGLARWLREELAVDAIAVRDLGLRNADDEPIFLAARAANAVVLSKDSDFVRLLEQYGPPPSVLWLTCGNTSNARVRALLREAWPQAERLLKAGDALVEIADQR